MLKVTLKDDFIDILDCKVEGDYPGCEGCQPEGDYSYDMCRCYTIHSAHVIDVEPWQILNIIERCSDSNDVRKVLEFMALKQLKESSLYDMFEVDYGGGYYGDEVRAIVPQPYFLQYLDELNKMNDIELLHYALSEEYGHLTDDVKNITSLSLKTVPLDKVTTPPGFKKIDPRRNKYKYNTSLTWSSPLVVPGAKDTYRLIDGCHRFTAILSEQDNKPKRKKQKVPPTISVLVGE